ncbi:autophagy protein Apg5-domain-containing protein [Pyronema omphalodes]|nr:autophagy protein Apg5-domain-containing protein [Pyronema omphalodes]
MDTVALRRALWNGSIPCRIELDPSESRVFDVIEPYFISLPRMSYIPLYMTEIYRFFTPFLIDTSVSCLENAWLEFESVPLKWHWPVGVLYDLFTGRDPTVTTADDEEEHSLPWKLVLRFQNFPSKHIMRIDSGNTFQGVWLNCLKEAAFSRNGHAKAVLGLSKPESTKLWEALLSHNFDHFWNVNEKILSEAIAGPLRSFSIRVYVPSTPRVIQQPIPPYVDNNEQQTVGTALNALLPELFPSKRTPVLSRPVIHGVVIPMSTPLIELFPIAMYPDGFLHITLAMSG